MTVPGDPTQNPASMRYNTLELQVNLRFQDSERHITATQARK